MDTCFEMGSCSTGPGCQSQSRRLLKEKKKASYSSQIPEMSRHPWEARAMKQSMVRRKSPMIGCPGRIKYHITLRNVISCFLWSNEEGAVTEGSLLGAGREGGQESHLPSLFVYSGYPRAARHTLIRTHLRGGPLFCSLHL